MKISIHCPRVWCFVRITMTLFHPGMHKSRLSIFWRPSTRYNGVSDHLRGGGSIAGFRAEEEGCDCRVFGFSGAKRPKRCRRCRFRNFQRFFENFTKLMYSKSTIIAFQWHFGGAHFGVRTLKKSQIFARTFKINISLPKTPARDV